MVLGFLKRKLTNHKNESQVIPEIKVGVVAFEDDCFTNSGKILAEYFENVPYLNVCYYDDMFNKKFLDLQSRNFFDFIDTGKKILKKTKTDVLVWGYREQNNLRLNFQTLNQYIDVKVPFFSLLNSLILPLDYFQEFKLPVSMLDLICAVILVISENSAYTEILKETVEKINNSSPPKDLDIKYMPYILNLLALAYLVSVKDTFQKQDIKIVSSILKNALKYLKKETNSLLVGLIYSTFGQLYQLATELNVDDRYANCKFATDFYNLALKYFPRHTFPYDFGHTAYRLSVLYFDYWKYTADIQFLRNAIFQLREAQKVFTQITFPDFWAIIQKDLGLYFSMMSVFSKNQEIALLAIENYKNYQKVCSRDKYPLAWAEIQEKIGNIFFECGKFSHNEECFDEAVKYYLEAQNIYEEHDVSENKKRIEKCLVKTDENLLRISNFN